MNKIDLKTVLKINKIQTKNLETNKLQSNNILHSKPEIPLSNGLISKRVNSKEKNRDRFESYDFINNNTTSRVSNTNNKSNSNNNFNNNNSNSNRTIDHSTYNYEESKNAIYIKNYEKNFKFGKEIFKSDKKNINFIVSTQSDNAEKSDNEKGDLVFSENN